MNIEITTRMKDDGPLRASKDVYLHTRVPMIQRAQLRPQQSRI